MKQFSGKWKVKKDGTMVLKWKKRKIKRYKKNNWMEDMLQ
jgi:hypothetical protein